MEQLTLGIALALLALAGWEAWKIHFGLESRTWEHTVGVVGKVWVEDMPDLELDQDPFKDREGTHSVHARYRYKVNGRWYDGRRVSYAATRWIRFRDALQMIEGLRTGREVDVFYDPEKPARAVLIPGSSTANLVLLCLYLVLAALIVMYWMR
jgi:hypothetical protein